VRELVERDAAGRLSLTNEGREVLAALLLGAGAIVRGIGMKVSTSPALVMSMKPGGAALPTGCRDRRNSRSNI
jgi:hypothetical protein